MKLSKTMQKTLARAASQFIAHNCEPKGAYGRTIWPSYGVRTPTLLALEARGLLARVEQEIVDNSMVITPAGVALAGDDIRARLEEEEEKAHRLLESGWRGLRAMGERKLAGVERLRRMWNL